MSQEILIVFIVFALIFLITSLFFLLFFKKILINIKSRYEDSLVLFTYDYKTNYIKFNYPEKPIIFDNITKISLANFLTLVVSKNHGDIKMIFEKALHLKNFSKAFRIKLTSKNSLSDYQLFFSYIDPVNQILYGTLTKLNKISAKKEKYIVTHAKTSINQNYADFVLNVFSLMFGTAKYANYFYYLELSESNLIHKYYGTEIYKLIILEIQNVLKKIFKKKFAITIIDNDKIIIYVQKNLNNIENVESKIKTIYKKVKKDLRKINNFFSLNLKIGVYYKKGIIDELEIKECITKSLHVLNCAIEQNKNFLIADDNNQIFKVEENNLSPEKALESQVSMSYLNLKSKKKAAYLSTFTLSGENLDSLNILNNSTQNKIINSISSKNEFYLIVNHIKAIIIKDSLVKEWYILISFTNLVKFFDDVCIQIKSIKTITINLVIQNYSWQTNAELNNLFIKLEKNKIKYGLNNFKFFMNYANILQTLKPQFLIVNEVITNESYKNPSLTAKLINLIYSCNKMGIIPIAHESENKERKQKLLNIGFENFIE